MDSTLTPYFSAMTSRSSNHFTVWVLCLIFFGVSFTAGSSVCADAGADTVEAKAKELREEQLWEDIQTFIDGYFPVDFVEQFLTSDWMLNWEINYLTPIKDDLHKFLENWESYYIHHSAYGDETREAYKSAQEVAKKEKSGK